VLPKRPDGAVAVVAGVEPEYVPNGVGAVVMPPNETVFCPKLGAAIPAEALSAGFAPNRPPVTAGVDCAPNSPPACVVGVEPSPEGA
jgi:hypothetical protein